MLLESPGEVVSREDIRKRLWPDNTVVEFDHSINAAVKRLRDALRDSADKPRYIETVARRGYRFIADIEPPTHQRRPGGTDRRVPPPTEPTNAQQAETPLPRAEAVPRSPFDRRPWIPAGLLAATVLMVWAGVAFNRRGCPGWGRSPSTPDAPGSRARKRSSSLVPITGPNAILSPDGTRLVYVSKSKLFIRRLDQAKAAELPGTENAEAPFFSPDGRWLAFFAGGN